MIAGRIFAGNGRVERNLIRGQRPILVAKRPQAEKIFGRISERYATEELVIIAHEIAAPGWSVGTDPRRISWRRPGA
jgi:hypothetical protein